MHSVILSYNPLVGQRQKIIVSHFNKFNQNNLASCILSEFLIFLEVKEEIIKLLRMYKRDFPDKCLSLILPEDLFKLLGEI